MYLDVIIATKRFGLELNMNYKNDKITMIGKSIIHYGEYNDRIYLMKLHNDDFNSITNTLDDIASQYGYSKIIAKVPSCAKDIFLNKKYLLEATIPDFYSKAQSAYFMSKYFSYERSVMKNKDEIEKVLKTSLKKQETYCEIILPDTFKFRQAQLGDASDMAKLYEKVFDSYPFPIFDPSYIDKTMKENIQYYGIWDNDKIVALSSSEMDITSLSVEMTDFATLPEYRGNGFALFLLNKMEKEMKKTGMKTAFTIARAISYGMNSTFAKQGYIFSGTLKNNTNISGNLESMNVWYKKL